LATLIPYNRRIDGLRAVAVLLVVFWHWFPQNAGINVLPNGQIGVATRNHFTETDWNPSNRWLVRDITAEVAGASHLEVVRYFG
jgi:hypothetical protein